MLDNYNVSKRRIWAARTVTELTRLKCDLKRMHNTNELTAREHVSLRGMATDRLLMMTRGNV